MDLIPLKKIAIDAALSAGRIIRTYMGQDIRYEKKMGGSNIASQVVTQVDRECELEIKNYLLPTCTTHNLALLTEETDDDGSRFEKPYFWCVDPIDGTLAFINKEPWFSVSIALVSRGGEAVIGVVYDPSTDTLYHAAKGHGVYRNDVAWTFPPPNDYLTYLTDKPIESTPRPEELHHLLNQKVSEQNLSGMRILQGGGSVLNAISVLQHPPACMIKHPKIEEGGGSIWDFASTACMFQELGLRASNFAGEPLDLNRKDSTFMNHQGIYYECSPG